MLPEGAEGWVSGPLPAGPPPAVSTEPDSGWRRWLRRLRPDNTGERPSEQRHGTSPPPQTAFVLAGGGNRGAIQVGMLRALSGAGIRPDFVVGASVGAINAAAYAADPSPEGVDRLAEAWLQLRDDTVFPHHHYGGWRFLQHRESVYPTVALRGIIDAFLPYTRLEDAAIPVNVVATNTRDNTETWIDRGPVTQALLASAAIPGVFPEVDLDGVPHVDGGVLNDVPISRAFEKEATRVIALLCGAMHPDPTPVHRPVEALMAAFGLAVHGRFLRELGSVPPGRQLIVIGCRVPELAGYWDFSRTAELIRAGEQSALAMLPALSNLQP